MTIRSKFYYYKKGHCYVYGGTMILKDRIITRLGNLPLEEEGRQFYYDSTLHTLTYESEEKKGVVDANKIITESSYKTTQLEYLVKLSWIQEQKLQWMFRRHWLQKPGNMVHLVILGLIITLAFMGFELLQHRNLY